MCPLRLVTQKCSLAILPLVLDKDVLVTGVILHDKSGNESICIII